MSDLATPQFSNGLDVAQHHVARVAEILGAQNEVVRLPASRERDPHSPIRDVVHDRPFFGDAKRMVKRKDDSSLRGCDVLRDRGYRRASHRGIRIESAERMEVPLGSPHRDEAVGVREPRTFEQQFVFLGLPFSSRLPRSRTS